MSEPKKRADSMGRAYSILALGGHEAPPEQTKLVISAERLPVESGNHQAVFFLRPDPKSKLELEELKVSRESNHSSLRAPAPVPWPRARIHLT